jgi:molecular chaperone GrpE
LAVFLTALPLHKIYKESTVAMNEHANQTENQPGNAEDLTPGMEESLAGSEEENASAEEISELDQLKVELAGQKDKYLRLVAEFENFKRRNAKERIELMQTAGRDVITELLDVLDDSDRAQKQLESSEDISQVREGILLVFNKLRSRLQARGLKPMETIGKEFNPDLHEAITEIPAPNKAMEGKVIDEVGKGYYLNDKIIRHAKVVVGAGNTN